MRITPGENPQKRRLFGPNTAPGQGGGLFRLDARPIRNGTDFRPFAPEPGGEPGGGLLGLGHDFGAEFRLTGAIGGFLQPGLHGCSQACHGFG